MTTEGEQITETVENNADIVQNQNQEQTQEVETTIENTAQEEVKTEVQQPEKVVEKIIEKVEVNPYEGLMDDEDKAYFNFKKETGRSRKEYEALNSNLDELPRLELARERVRRETGLNLTNEQIDEHIAETLGIDLEDLSNSDQIRLAAYTKSILDEKKAEQQKYRTPIENKQTENKENNPQQEYVSLDNGAVMRKEDFDRLESTRQQEILKAKEAVNSVTNSDFKITIDEKGTPKELNFNYEYSEEDKQSMLSIVSDIDNVIKTRYSSENGFNHKAFAEDMHWSDPKFREKAVASLIHKAIAGNTEEILKERGNVNFTQEPLQKQNREGVKIVSVKDAIKGNY